MNWGILTPNDDPLDGYCPGPGTRYETIKGGPDITTVVVNAQGVGTINTTFANSLSVGTMVRLKGATVDTDLNSEYFVSAVPTSTSATIQTSNVSAATYSESTIKFEYVKYQCGGSNAELTLNGSTNNRYATTCNGGLTCNGTTRTTLDDPRSVSDPDGPWNNRFGDFLSHVRIANGYWLTLLPTRPKVVLGN
jgi:hypothetical protein